MSFNDYVLNFVKNEKTRDNAGLYKFFEENEQAIAQDRKALIMNLNIQISPANCYRLYCLTADLLIRTCDKNSAEDLALVCKYAKEALRPELVMANVDSAKAMAKLASSFGSHLILSKKTKHGVYTLI